MAPSPEDTGRNQDGTFAKGVSGNPAGRPKGSRSKLAEDFFRVLAKDFAENGVKAILSMRENDPPAYAKMIASLMAKEVTGEDGEPIQVAHEIILRGVKPE